MRETIGLTVLTPDDWSQWRELRLCALTEAPYAFGSRIEDRQEAEETRWRHRLSLSDSCNLIARLDGRPVGMASCVPTEEAGAAQLISMWVAPDARGRGVGDALITAIARWAIQHGARELRLDVVAGNTRAIALYARHGFVDIGPSSEVGERTMVKVLGSMSGQFGDVRDDRSSGQSHPAEQGDAPEPASPAA